MIEDVQPGSLALEPCSTLGFWRETNWPNSVLLDSDRILSSRESRGFLFCGQDYSQDINAKVFFLHTRAAVKHNRTAMRLESLPWFARTRCASRSFVER